MQKTKKNNLFLKLGKNMYLALSSLFKDDSNEEELDEETIAELNYLNKMQEELKNKDNKKTGLKSELMVKEDIFLSNEQNFKFEQQDKEREEH